MAFGSINYSKLVYHPKVYYPEDPPRLDGWKARRLAGEKVGRSDGWKVGRISRNFVSAPGHRHFPYSKDFGVSPVSRHFWKMLEGWKVE